MSRCTDLGDELTIFAKVSIDGQAPSSPWWSAIDSKTSLALPVDLLFRQTAFIVSMLMPLLSLAVYFVT
jgi:hypothetical protein